MLQPTVITLIEHQPYQIPITKLPITVVEQLQALYGSQVMVESSRLSEKWALKNKGWVGYIPLTAAYHFRLESKVPLHNLFGMISYAYEWANFQWLEGLMTCESLPKFYNRLALKLAELILQRSKQGLYRAYIPHQANLSYVRGRIQVTQAIRQPHKATLPCHYEEHTADIPDNQILAWTLYQIMWHDWCDETVLPTLHRAYHALSRLVTVQPYTANDCVNRKYHRLNEDYQIMHQLCHFFLERSGPTQQAGNALIMPFLVNMWQLYERFVVNWLAEWLKQHPEARFTIIPQKRVHISTVDMVIIDLVVVDKKTGQTIWVLDTKYKRPRKIDEVDRRQVLEYAEVENCQQAGLIYPHPIETNHPQTIGNITIYPFTFDVSQNLEAAGLTMLGQLGLL